MWSCLIYRLPCQALKLNFFVDLLKGNRTVSSTNCAGVSYAQAVARNLTSVAVQNDPSFTPDAIVTITVTNSKIGISPSTYAAQLKIVEQSVYMRKVRANQIFLITNLFKTKNKGIQNTHVIKTDW